ncbi:hypothetical protein XI25_11515 [Paenibacillus sp. DMB20]|nr:hypothetical protein XI25_11515 [Paenibacillus sp. DMB20]
MQLFNEMLDYLTQSEKIYNINIDVIYHAEYNYKQRNYNSEHSLNKMHLMFGYWEEEACR